MLSFSPRLAPCPRDKHHTDPNGERPAESVVSEHTQALDLGALIQCGTEGEREGGGIYTVVAPTGDRRRRPLEGPRTRILMHSSAFRCIHSHTRIQGECRPPKGLAQLQDACMLTRVCILTHSYAFSHILTHSSAFRCINSHTQSGRVQTSQGAGSAPRLVHAHSCMHSDAFLRILTHSNAFKRIQVH